MPTNLIERRKPTWGERIAAFFTYIGKHYPTGRVRW